ncbi:MAG: protein kinase [Anaerolineae bacterium]|nr:MAG: protein kinase [Anaerolineae bacterium]
MATFGNYTLLEPIGRGDMGTTYRAQAQGSSDIVALKVLDKVEITSVGQLGSAVDLARFAATFSHPRLHPTLEVIEIEEGDGGQIGIVTPFAAAGPLSAVFARGTKIPPKQTFKVLGQLASALQHLHDQEVAHGSVKPTNVLLDAEGNAALTDLSMAHLRELGLVPADGPTRQHLFFMAPEREYHAAPEVIGDVFSLGVLAAMMFTGRLPFDQPEPEARGVLQIEGVPPAIAAVLRRELNPQLRWRYTDLGSFMGALKEATQGKVDPETERLFGVKQPPPEP